MPCQWKRLDRRTVQDFPVYLDDDDECYYAREYVSHGRYDSSEANRLIWNFKKHPSTRDTNQRYWRDEAVRRLNHYVITNIFFSRDMSAKEIGFKAGREVTTQADFTYKIKPDTISIVDSNQGARSITNDIENALRKIEHYHQGSIAAFKTMYRDSEGISEWSKMGRSKRIVLCLTGNRRAKSARETLARSLSLSLELQVNDRRP